MEGIIVRLKWIPPPFKLLVLESEIKLIVAFKHFTTITYPTQISPKIILNKKVHIRQPSIKLWSNFS